jgi:MoxR-like ATPase
MEQERRWQPLVSASFPGRSFSQLLMADEINRASPRTQSALLQAMQEYHVTVAGHRYMTFRRPFHVLATQNPLEQEGTYPLPEAQLDRFLMQIDVHYPDLEAERRILLETTGAEEGGEALYRNDRRNELAGNQQLVRQACRSVESVVEAILKLVQGCPSGRDGSGNATHGPHLPGDPARAPARHSCSPYARARCSTAASRLRSTTFWPLPSRSCNTAWQLTFAARADGHTVRDVITRVKESVG